MQRHLRRCPGCSARATADRKLDAALREAGDSPEEAAAVARITGQWLESIPAETQAAPAPASPARRRVRWMPATAAVAIAAGMVAIGIFTEPARAMRTVTDAMKRVKRFHVRMELPLYGVRYEAWGQKRQGVRVEEWVGDRRTMVVVDDGETLSRYYPDEEVIRRSGTRLKSVYRYTAGFNASRLLRQAAQGELLDGHEWIGKPTARRVVREQRGDAALRRIDLDLKDGFFERMIILADEKDGVLVQANLYTDSGSDDQAPFARVFFDYPEKLKPSLFKLTIPSGVPVRHEESDLRFP